METNSRSKEVIVIPYPIQGHINPMLQFSKQLASRGLNVTLATTSAYSSIFTELQSSSAITIETIDDGSHEAANPGNVEAYIKRFDVVGPKSLAQLVEKRIGSYDDEHNSKHNVRCIIYDSCIPWALDVARKYGLYGASFFTQSCLVNEIFYQVYEGILSAPVKEPIIMCVDGLSLIQVNDLPSFVREVGLFPCLEKLALNQFSNVKDADWRFFNTFDGLENEVLDMKHISSNPMQKTMVSTFKSSESIGSDRLTQWLLSDGLSPTLIFHLQPTFFFIPSKLKKPSHLLRITIVVIPALPNISDDVIDAFILDDSHTGK